MKFTREQKQSAYRKLSSEMQSFVMDNDTTEIIGNFLKESGLSEEQENLADSEIFYALLGLQTLSAAIENIAKLSNKNIADLSGLKEKLDSQIFNELAKLQTEKETGYEESGHKEKVEEKQNEEISTQRSESGVGKDFEQIILNQARAMRPAVVASSEQQVVSSKVEEKKQEPKVIHNYIGENDPYREPIE